MPEAEMDDNQYLNSKQACKFLAKQWKMKSYSEDSFRALCSRRGLEPDLGEGRSAKYWKIGTLKKIHKPEKGTRKKDDSESSDQDSHLSISDVHRKHAPFSMKTRSVLVC